LIGLLAALAAVFVGLLVKSALLIGFGFAAIAVQLMLDYLAPVAQAAAAPRARHRLINAPDDAWKIPEDELWTHMMSMGGPMSIGMPPNPMAIATSRIQSPHVAGAVQPMLPFPNYGRQGPLGVVENMFIGFPISIGNFIRR